MMIIAIAVSTMITVALVVFAVQYLAYRKNHPKQDIEARKEPARGTREAPLAS